MKEREKPNLDHNKRLPSFQSEREDKKLRWKIKIEKKKWNECKWKREQKGK